MISKTKNKITIDIAWEQLYNRLACENLLAIQTISSGQTFLKSKGFRWAANIAILCVCVLSVWLIKQQQKSAESNFLVLYNELNVSTLATTLEDGSIVYLSGQATIRYPEHFPVDKRTISLQGDAYFEISSQPERPFLIDTKLAEVEVLGTYFQVKSSDRHPFIISVRTGEVKVSIKKSNQTVYVKAGETAILESDTIQLTKNTSHTFDNCFEKIHFKDERLADIAHIINLNSSVTPIEISPELENRRLNCTIDFSGDTPEEIAELISMALNLTYSKHQEIIYITK